MFIISDESVTDCRTEKTNLLEWSILIGFMQWTLCQNNTLARDEYGKIGKNLVKY